ncbi:hypothetical protein ASC94_04565 [Massilia sp. Root418]|nr:hypothetical protein ASC94_04565 [Massilia sp. Root418]
MLAVALGTGLLLLVPLVAMRFTAEVDWSGGDFAVAGLLLAGTGMAYVLAARMVRSAPRRLAVGLALALLLAVVWAELAVGVFGTPFAGS